MLAIAVMSFSTFQSALADSEAETRAMNGQVLNLLKSRRYEEAETIARRALILCEDAGGFKAFCKGQYLELLGNIFFDRRQYTEALPYLQQSLEVRQTMLGKKHFVAGRSHLWITRTLFALNRAADAEGDAKAAVDIFSATAPTGNDLAVSLGYLAKIFTESHRCTEAEPLVDHQISLLTQLYGASSPSVEYAKYVEVIILNCNDELVRAEEFAHQIVASISTQSADNKIKQTLLRQLFEVGTKFHAAKDNARAEVVLRDGLLLVEQTESAPLEYRKYAMNVLNLLGIVLSNRGRWSESIDPLQRALLLGEKLYANDDANLANIISNLAVSYQQVGRNSDAVVQANRAIAMCESAHVQNMALGFSFRSLGRAKKALGQFADAESALESAKNILNLVLPKEDVSQAISLSDIGDVLSDIQKWTDASAHYERVLLLESQYKYSDTSIRSTALAGLGLALRAEERYAEAEANLRESIAIEEHITTDRRSYLGQRLSGLASILRRENKFNEAEAVLNRARTLDQSPIFQAEILNSLGLIYAATDRMEDARKAYETAIHDRELEHVPDNEISSLDIRLNLANLEQASGYNKKAEEIFRQNLDRIRTGEPVNILVLAQHQLFLANQLRLNGKLDEAESLAQETLSIYQQRLEPTNLKIRYALETLSLIKMAKRQYGEAESLLDRALAFDQPALDRANALNALAKIYSLTDRLEIARQTFKEVKAIQEDVHIPENDDRLLETYSNIASLEIASGHYKEAEIILRANLERANTRTVSNELLIARQQLPLAEYLGLVGKLDEAASLAEEASKTFENETFRENETAQQNLNLALRILASIHGSNGKLNEQENVLRRLIAEDKEVKEILPSLQTDALVRLAVNLRSQGKYSEASDIIRSAFEHIKSIDEKTTVQDVRSRESLAYALLYVGKRDAADHLFHDNIAAIEKGIIHADWETSVAYRNFGSFLVRTGRSEKAILAYRSALSIDEKMSGSKSRRTALDHLGLAEALRLLGRRNEARTELNEASEDIRHLDDPSLTAKIDSQLTALAVEKGDFAESLLHAEHAVEFLTTAFGDEAPALIPALCELGTSYLLINRQDDAENTLKRIDRIMGSDRKQNWTFVEVTKFRGLMLLIEGNRPAARSLFESLIVLADRSGNINLAGMAAYNIGYLELADHNYSKAVTSFESAATIFTQCCGANSLVRAYNFAGLASAYDGVGNHKKAVEATASGRQILKALNLSSVSQRNWL